VSVNSRHSATQRPHSCVIRRKRSRPVTWDRQFVRVQLKFQQLSVLRGPKFWLKYEQMITDAQWIISYGNYGHATVSLSMAVLVNTSYYFLLPGPVPVRVHL